jgi:preprotein translocase subunit SecG
VLAGILLILILLSNLTVKKNTENIDSKLLNPNDIESTIPEALPEDIPLEIPVKD